MILLRYQMNWLKSLKGKIRFNEPLSQHTTFRIGGVARLFYQPRDFSDLRQLIIHARRDKIRILVIGAGSNLLVSDQRVKGIVVGLDKPVFKDIKYCGGLLEVGAGMPLAGLIKSALDYNLSGCEFLVGIPGTVGGALVMNAGISEKGKNIAELVKDVTVMDYNGEIRVLRRKDIRFAYRASSLYTPRPKTTPFRARMKCGRLSIPPLGTPGFSPGGLHNYIVLKTCLKLSQSNKRKIRDNLKRYFGLRRKQQDYGYPSAGCVFRNPEGLSAGKLIDMCGLKGKHFGHAYVSDKHANFIVNKGKATARDVLRLMDYVKKRVEHKFDIELEPEIKIWQ